MNKEFIMLSGLPRSGSSVLTSLLNQHPNFHASTTSPVIDMIEILNNNWPTISNALINQPETQYPSMIAGLIDGVYDHIPKPVVIDKNRLWPRYGKLMAKVLNAKPKIICTVRSIPEIMASYILLINKNSDKITFIDQDLIDLKQPINNKNRCNLLLSKYINGPYNSARIGFNTPDIDLCIVNYDEIVNNSQATMDKICQFIGHESIEVNLSNLQPMDENDIYHGGIYGLHDVRPVMQRTSPPAEQVIGRELVKLYTDMKLDFWNK